MGYSRIWVIKSRTIIIMHIRLYSLTTLAFAYIASFGYCQGVEEGSVRIIAVGNNPDEGLLEVFYHGSWGTVCDDLFDDNAATAVCRSMGYDGGHAWDDGMWLGGREEQTIWLDDVVCGSEAASLQECGHSEVGDSNCSHIEDVNIACHYD